MGTPMRCPACQSQLGRVVLTREVEKGVVVRRRHCKACENRWYTLQPAEVVIDQSALAWSGHGAEGKLRLLDRSLVPAPATADGKAEAAPAAERSRSSAGFGAQEAWRKLADQALAAYWAEEGLSLMSPRRMAAAMGVLADHLEAIAPEGSQAPLTRRTMFAAAEVLRRPW